MTDQKEIVLTTNEYYHPGCAVTNTEVKLPPGVDFKGWEATLLVRDKDNWTAQVTRPSLKFASSLRWICSRFLIWSLGRIQLMPLASQE